MKADVHFTCSIMRLRHSVADATGLFVLAVLAGLVAWLVADVYSKEDAVWAWSIGFPVLGICGLIAWHSARWPTAPRDVFGRALISILAGFVSFVADALISTSTHPQLPFRYAIWHAGSPFGIVLTIAICPGFTLIALAGAVRALLLSNNTDSMA